MPPFHTWIHRRYIENTGRRRVGRQYDSHFYIRPRLPSRRTSVSDEGKPARRIGSGPFIIKVPGKTPGVCHSFAELLDLYPTAADLLDLKPPHLQGEKSCKDLDDPSKKVRTWHSRCRFGGERLPFYYVATNGLTYNMMKTPSRHGIVRYGV